MAALRSCNKAGSGPGADRVAGLALTLFLLFLASPVVGIDLSGAELTRLDNGLTLIVLEDSTFPVVSVQVLYRVGARHEQVGQTGIAHFLEHMAFRDTENFPDTDVVSRIYAVGGEWHGYTWLDQTTYFETLPAEHLDLALHIEADRMARLLIPSDQVEPERGAILAEMHGYENDPSSLLHDAVLTMSFLQHPYRNNTIGWESDVESITHADIVRFYRSYYQPANAILAVAGDVSRRQVVERVTELFGRLPGGTRAVPPPTVEPPQQGLRRLVLEGAGSRSYFKVAYRAPGVTDPDYVPFLVMQEVLSGGSGVNFSQNEWGDSVRPGSRMDGLLEDVVTWFIPTAAPYVFTLGGTVDADASTEEMEARLEEVVQSLRERPASQQELADAKRHLLRELIFDVETTEDAAHQLSFFEGLDGLSVLLDLPSRIAAVSAGDVRRVARTYLRPEQRTIGWHMAGSLPQESEQGDPGPVLETVKELPKVDRRVGEAPSDPKLANLSNGLPVLFRRVSLSPAAFLRLLVPTTGIDLAGNASRDYPVWRHTSLDFRFQPEELQDTLQRARSILTAGQPVEETTSAMSIRDPESRLTIAMDELLGVHPLESGEGVAAVALVGDLDEAMAFALLEATLGDIPVAAVPTSPILELKSHRSVVQVDFEIAQAQLGYIVPAPPPSDPDAWAWRILLYILSHGYEGRLGKEAITRQGLVYYIDSSYDSDGTNGRVTLKIGVDPQKVEPMRSLMEQMLRELQTSPPTAVEITEAKQHLLGRRQSAAQSNEEISATLIRDWHGRGRILTMADYAEAVSQIEREDVLRILPEFVNGAVVVVESGGLGRPISGE